jgi:hypothetical protein
MLGGPGDDTLDGVDGTADSMSGEDGNDSLYGDFNKDKFDGGSGSNRFFDENDNEFDM